jgi:transcriptional regulator with XRE-family HTH domain
MTSAVQTASMATTRSPRERQTELRREAERRTTSLALTLGADVRRGRQRRRVTQRALADEIGVDQTRISQIERGLGSGVTLATWVALGIALDRPLAISLTRPLPATHSPVDAGHLEMQEVLLAIAARTGRRAAVERPSKPLDPRHSTDVAIHDDAHRTLVLAEVWNTFGDIGAAIRSTHRKQAEALGMDDDVDRVVTVWIVRSTTANRAIVARYPNLFAAAFDGSSRRWVHALADGTAPPDRPGLVWLDPSTARLSEWRRR